MKYQHASIIVLAMTCIISCKEPSPPAAFEWRIAATLTGAGAPGVAGPVAGTSNGYLVVAGGANFPEALPWEGGNKVYHDALYLFRINGGYLEPVATEQRLPDTVAYAASAQTPDGICYAGGENGADLSAKVYRLQVNNGTAITNRLPDLPMAVTNGSMSAYKGYLYFTGGETPAGTSDKMWMLALHDAAAGWQELPPVPHPVSHGVQLMLNENGRDMLYLIGGRAKNPDGISTLHTAVYAFDLTDKKWWGRPPLPYSLAAGTGIVVDNKAYLFGGDKGTIFTQVENLLAEAAQQTGANRDSLIAQKNQLQIHHAGFSKTILCYTPGKNEWRSAGDIPFTVPVTTTALVAGDHIYITSGESRPGVRIPDILAGQISRSNH